jgi:hypothetical protein
MAKKDLRAFVRIDGSGRTIPGSMVLRKKKPKAGRWFEVRTEQCCDPQFDTTTTTTTEAPTTTTTTTGG